MTRAGRWRPVYEDIAESLREQIAAGSIAHGKRLPTEAALAESFGVSRATIREALRLLAAQDLIRTDKGPLGGSYVTVPRFGHITETLRGSISALSLAEQVTVQDLLFVRAALEIPAASLAASRRRVQDVNRLRDTMSGVRAEVATLQNRDFHTIVLEACGNVLLALAAQPIFAVLLANVDESKLTQRYKRAIRAQHRDIADAIDVGDSEAAAALMEHHLDFVGPHYERAWVTPADRHQPAASVRPSVQA